MNVDLAAIFFPAQFLYEREQEIARIRVLLRGAGSAHSVDVFVAGHVAHQQFIVAETRPAELIADFLQRRLGRLPFGERFRTRTLEEGEQFYRLSLLSRSCGEFDFDLSAESAGDLFECRQRHPIVIPALEARDVERGVKSFVDSQASDVIESSS